MPASQHSSSYLSGLTALRGIAAILVAIFHFEMAVGRFVPAQVTMFFEKSYLMVDLFFVLSGFIMVHVYGATFRERLDKTAFWKFLVARFARIYPLHFFSLLLLILLTMALPPADIQYRPVEATDALVNNFLLLHVFNLNRIYTWNIPSWSIGAEWWCYLLFPGLVLFFWKRKTLAVVFFILSIAALYFSIMYLFPRVNPLYPVPVPHNINSTYDYGFWRGLAGFMTGMLMYAVYESRKFKELLQKDISTLILILLTAAGLHFAVNDTICVSLFAVLIVSAAANNGYVCKAFNNRILQYIGNISYSIYMMQIFLQVPFSHGYRLPGVTGFGRGKLNIDFTHGLLYCGIYLLLLVTLSTASYYGIERPCRRYINRRWG